MTAPDMLTLMSLARCSLMAEQGAQHNFVSMQQAVTVHVILGKLDGGFDEYFLLKSGLHFFQTLHCQAVKLPSFRSNDWQLI